MDGDWDCDDLTSLVHIIINDVKQGVAFGFPGKEWILKASAYRNTISKSLSNVQIHYDLGNDFYSLMLDKPTMSYTCALFRNPEELAFIQFPTSPTQQWRDISLDEAQLNKINYIVRKAQIKKESRVLELGCGWGGFAIEASSCTGCFVDAYNLSIEQVTYAREQAVKKNVGSRVNFIHADYRQSTGLYDVIVSIGMLEHVGHDDVPTFFQHCERLLKPNGVLVVHTITSPDYDYHLTRYTYGFIQKYIFPGSCIPSVKAIMEAMKTSHFELQHMDNIGQHYAITLRKWRENFYRNINEVFRLGYSYQFARMWDMYLCNCEAEFLSGHLGLGQFICRRPSSKDTDIIVAKMLKPLKSLCCHNNICRIRHDQAVIQLQNLLQGRNSSKKVVPHSRTKALFLSLIQISAVSAINYITVRYRNESFSKLALKIVISVLACSHYFPRVCQHFGGLLGEFRGYLNKSSRQDESTSDAHSKEVLQVGKSTTSNLFRIQRLRPTSRVTPGARRKLWLGDLNQVIDVNTKEGYADVEGCTTFEEFVRVTSKVKYIPLVVPELKSITVGGAIVGLGIESSSFRYGFVHEGMIQAEVLLSSGHVITCSSSENPDLFAALPNSHGSLGYLLSVRMKIRPMKSYVRINKVLYNSVELLCQTIIGITSAGGGKSPASKVSSPALHPSSSIPPSTRKESDQSNVDFIEAVSFGDSKGGMLLLGTMVDSVPSDKSVSSYRTKNRFYETLHKEGYDYLTTVDYLWRWDTDWFWVSQIFPGLRSSWFRSLLGEKLLRSDKYKAFNDFVIAMTGQPKDQELVIQDYEIPAEVCAEWIHAHHSIVPKGKVFITAPDGSQQRPIWLCPIRGAAHALFPMKPDRLYINCGFWDAVTVPKNAVESINVALEKQCQRLEGLKTLYSSVHYPYQEFREIFNMNWYDQIKAKYDPENKIADLYSKVTK